MCCKFRMSVQRSENLPRCQQLVVQQASVWACCLPTGAFCTHPLLPQFIPRLANHTSDLTIHKSSSLESFIEKKNNKKRRTKHLYILWDFSYFPLVLLGSAPFFSFFSPESPTKLGAPRHKGCSSPSLSSFSCHGSMPYWYWSPQGLYTLLSGSKGAAIIPI